MISILPGDIFSNCPFVMSFAVFYSAAKKQYYTHSQFHHWPTVFPEKIISRCKELLGQMSYLSQQKQPAKKCQGSFNTTIQVNPNFIRLTNVCFRTRDTLVKRIAKYYNFTIFWIISRWQELLCESSPRCRWQGGSWPESGVSNMRGEFRVSSSRSTPARKTLSPPCCSTTCDGRREKT